MSKMSKAIAVLGVVAGLGVAALPLSSYAVAGKTATATTTAQAIVGDSIAITVADDTVTMNNVEAGKDVNEASTNVTVQTNNAAGYKVQISDNDGTHALMPNGGNGTATGIPAGVPARNTNAWGFKSSSTSSNVTVSSTQQNYRALGEDAMTIATAAGPSANEGDVIQLTFGVTVNNTIAAGTYENQVTLTATTN